MVLKPEPESGWVLTTLRGLADVRVSENHVWLYYCIKSFCSLNILEKCFEKFNFYITIMTRKSMKDS